MTAPTNHPQPSKPRNSHKQPNVALQRTFSLCSAHLRSATHIVAGLVRPCQSKSALHKAKESYRKQKVAAAAHPCRAVQRKSSLYKAKCRCTKTNILLQLHLALSRAKVRYGKPIVAGQMVYKAGTPTSRTFTATVTCGTHL